jgi:hypothetical protein
MWGRDPSVKKIPEDAYHIAASTANVFTGLEIDSDRGRLMRLESLRVAGISNSGYRGEPRLHGANIQRRKKEGEYMMMYRTPLPLLNFAFMMLR